MSKADELLKHLYFQFTDTYFAGKNYKEFKSRTLSNELVKDIENYLNRKNKLVAGSEWVCDVECYATNRLKTYRIRKNKVLTITFFKEDGYNVYFDFYDDVLDTSHLKNTNKFKFVEVKTSCVMPTEQFLACFSPKEKDNE